MEPFEAGTWVYRKRPFFETCAHCMNNRGIVKNFYQFLERAWNWLRVDDCCAIDLHVGPTSIRWEGLNSDNLVIWIPMDTTLFQYCQKLVIFDATFENVLLCRRKGENDFDGFFTFP